MKRSPLLLQLSREHHAALKLARRAQAAQEASAQRQFMRDLVAHWNNELLPHFAEEERLLPPQLDGSGKQALSAQLLSEHAQLRDLAARILGGETAALEPFGRLLAAHVRFEERILFPCYEALASAAG